MAIDNTAYERTSKNQLPDTGIGGVYEVCLATKDITFAIDYFKEFGFTEVASVSMSADEANNLYGYNEALSAYRLQNQHIDSHGLIRLMSWDKFENEGVGLVAPRSIGQRLAVMHCADIYRLKDVFENAISEEHQWNITDPIADDLFGLNKEEKSFFKRPVVVRENAVYGNFFNHVFFQRYGYHIDGYGTINTSAPLKTSEFTHHDFFINCNTLDEMKYLSTALGLKAEEMPKIDSAAQKGPKAVFQMKEGESHWYQGFVSPNNICGKLKMFIPTEKTLDYSQNQKIGAQGITQHTFCTEKLEYVRTLVEEHNLSPTPIIKNEFGEQCFNFTGPGGCSWQIIKKHDFKNAPKRNLEFSYTNN